MPKFHNSKPPHLRHSKNSTAPKETKLQNSIFPHAEVPKAQPKTQHTLANMSPDPDQVETKEEEVTETTPAPAKEDTVDGKAEVEAEAAKEETSEEAPAAEAAPAEEKPAEAAAEA